MTILESLTFSEYIRFLKLNKIVDIDKYKKEYIEYLEIKNKQISEPLEFFLNEKEESENVKVKKLEITIEKINFPKR